MAQLYCGKNCIINTKQCKCLLAVCWIAGLLCGIFCFFQAGAPIISLMRRALIGSVSIVSLFRIYFIPFLFTAFAVFTSELRFLFLPCFCKGCLYSLVSLGLCAAFGSSGWLMQGLLLFSDSVCVLLFYLVWDRLLSGRSINVLADMIAVIIICVSVCVIDYYIISPFLACLIEI